MPNDEGMTKHDDSDGPNKWSWLNSDTPFVREESDTKPLYDLEERTARFGEAIIDFAKKSRMRRQRTGLVVNSSARERVWARITTKPTMLSRAGILEVYWHVQERSAREQTFFADGGSGRSRAEIRSARSLARSASPAHNLCEDLEERKESRTNFECRTTNEIRMTKFLQRVVVWHLSSVLHSSFSIRISSF